jgi:tight adherence protein C
MQIISEYMPILISSAAFLTLLLVFLGIASYYTQRTERRKLTEKIRKGSEEAGAPKAPDATDTSLKSRDKVQNRISNFLGRFGKRVAPKQSKDYRQMRPRFLKAGFRRETAPAIFWGTKCLLAICLPMCFLLLRLVVFGPLSIAMTGGICLYLALMGFFLPDIWLRIRIARRRERIFKGFPDALDLLVVCVEAGMGIDSAINRVAEEMKISNKTLSDELKLLNLEIRAGKTRRDALKDLAMRTDLQEVESLATLLIQTEKFGTNVAQTLRVYSDMFRTKRYQRAEEIAAKMPIKMVIPLAFFIFPSLFVVLLGPAAINIYKVLLSR